MSCKLLLYDNNILVTSKIMIIIETISKYCLVIVFEPASKSKHHHCFFLYALGIRHKYFFVVFMLILDLLNLNSDNKTTIPEQLVHILWLFLWFSYKIVAILDFFMYISTSNEHIRYHYLKCWEKKSERRGVKLLN